jgi:hypothetical protein
MEIDSPKTPTTRTTETQKVDKSSIIPTTNTHSTDGNNLDESPSPNSPKKPPTRKTVSIKHQHTCRILIKAYANEKERDDFNRLQVLQIVLKALQKSDPVTGLIIPSDDQFHTRVYTNINPESKNKKEYEKIEQLLHFSGNNIIQGTIQVTTNTIYSTIKKNLETRKTLQEKFPITLYRNNIKATNLTEVGFFANHLVRHDTIECTKWISAVLPLQTPDFQSELITVFAGPPKERITAGVLKIYADRENVQQLSTLFRNQFKNELQIIFIPKEYFDTLNPQQKAKFIKSQFEYQRMYRSTIVKGIRNVNLPANVKKNDTYMSIKEWLATVPDYQQNNLFPSNYRSEQRRARTTLS